MTGFLRRVLRPRQRAGDTARSQEQADSRIFAGFFVASLEHVESWDLTGLTPAEWPAVEFKRISSVNLGTLEAILTDTPYDDIDQDDLHRLIRDGGSEGPWITPVRTELRDRLARLAPERVGAVAAAWANTDEFKVRASDRPRPEDVADLTASLHEIVALARRSTADAKPMYLLMGL